MKVISFFNRQAAMQAPLVNIQNIRVASPCPADWNTMAGDDRVRHCSECSLSVHNLSAMTEQEVQRLIANSQGRICGRFYRRADGTILTQDCPRGLRAVARRVSRTAAALLTAVMSVSFAVAGTKPKAQQTEHNQCREPGVELVVIDPQGAVIQHAEVTLSDKAGKKKRSGKTNAAGQLILNGVPTGEYVITASSPGFQTSSTAVSVREGRLFELKFKLGLGETKTEVVVQAGDVVVQGTAVMGYVTTQSDPLFPAGFSRGQPQPMR
ncbi:MAG TPA: carboxypeptidase-like regulatory domain-containing protein [Verrucomicrobiae bacterium]|jgi:hypothetical protein|nr:carboxypeptidase-like regulatory domain-containing protein [Verrucomicrobiae bacterium]